MGFVSVWLWERMGSGKDLWRLLMPISFPLHIVWIVFTVFIAKSSEFNQVGLPIKFRAVLYLDVFGWLNEGQDASTYGGVDAGAASAPINNLGRGEHLPPVAEDDESVVGVPLGARDVLLEQCARLRMELSQDLSRWQSNEVQELLEEDPG